MKIDEVIRQGENDKKKSQTNVKSKKSQIIPEEIDEEEAELRALLMNDSKKAKKQ